MPNPIDLTGIKFGRLTVVSLQSAGSRGKHGREWLCSCDCGGQSIVKSGNLRSGNSTSCPSCRYRNAVGTPKHGHRKSDADTSPTYKTWKAMKHRLVRKSFRTYASIDMDPRWAEFDAFLADMGDRPDGMTLDRKDNAVGYWKHNCRWATAVTQTRNRRISLLFEWKGRTLPIAEWAKELGMSFTDAYDRITRHNSLDPAPPRSKKLREACRPTKGRIIRQ